jgi:antitoxin FitA
MARTVQIRGLDDEVYAALKRRAAEVGMSVPEYLRREAERLASRLTVTEWIERTRRRGSSGDTLETVAALDKQRGSWPE